MFDELHGFRLGHSFAAILAMRARQRRRQFEPNDLSFHYGCRIHLR